MITKDKVTEFFCIIDEFTKNLDAELQKNLKKDAPVDGKRRMNRKEACVAYQGTDYRTITMAFPFECIREQQKRTSIMRGLLQFLIKN